MVTFSFIQMQDYIAVQVLSISTKYYRIWMGVASQFNFIYLVTQKDPIRVRIILRFENFLHRDFDLDQRIQRNI